MSALKNSPRLNDAENDFMTSALQDECMEHALVERQIPMALGAGIGIELVLLLSSGL